MADVTGNITEALSHLGDIELSGIRLEEAKPELLDITQGSLDQHVAMQPAAMAYYISIKKMAKRQLDNLTSAHDRWEKKQYAVAKAAVESGCTAKSAIKVEEVKARFITDNEPEIEKWEKRIDKAQAVYDDLDAWAEAWKQKSFSIREFVSLEGDEQGNQGTSIGNGEERGGPVNASGRAVPGAVTQRVRELIGRKKVVGA